MRVGFFLRERTLAANKPWLDSLRKELIVSPIQNDKRTKYDMPLGRDVKWIFDHAIGGGQANFDVPIEDISSRDRVLLYAYLNQKAHIDELIHAFAKLIPEPPPFQNATVIDIGCGPFTAGLALANIIGTSVGFRYFGVDHSLSMRTYAKELADHTHKVGELNARTEIAFFRDLTDIDFGRPRASEVTIFVLSYLLASTSIDVELLANQINFARKKVGLGPTILLYTNSGRAGARASFPLFSKCLVNNGFKEHIEETESFEGSIRPRHIHYALFTAPAVAKFKLLDIKA